MADDSGVDHSSQSNLNQGNYPTTRLTLFLFNVFERYVFEIYYYSSDKDRERERVYALLYVLVQITCQREILYNIRMMASIPAAEDVDVEVRGGEGGGASPTSDTEKELPEKIADEEETLTWFERIRNLFPFLRHCKQLRVCVTVAAVTVMCVCYS